MTGLIERLLASPEAPNPAVEMSAWLAELQRSGQLDQVRIQELLPAIEAAADQGERDLDGAGAARRSLERAGAIPSKEVPLGF